jgi:hypothetical protein
VTREEHGVRATAKAKSSTPLRVVDVMVLVAATALGLGLTRAVSPQSYLLPYLPSSPDGEFVDWGEVPIFSKLWLTWADTTLQHRFIYFSPLVAAWTMAVLALSLRGPRRAWPRLMRRPGTVAGLAASSGFVFAAGSLLVSAQATNRFDQSGSLFLFATGMAVAGAWTVLAASGRWRPEWGVLDRVGQLLGLLWIAMGPLVTLLRLAGFW